MEAAIRLEGVEKTYRVPSPVPWRPSRRVVALRGVSFSCPQGAVTCILGPNGAGKTTIIKILSGLVRPDRGRVSALGAPLDARPWTRIGVASPNERSFYLRLTGRQNLEFFASLHGLSGAARARRVEEALAEAGIDAASADKAYMVLSSGNRQKLLVARALLGRPAILLLDEPTSHLDPLARDALHGFLRRFLRRDNGTDAGVAVLLCTHDVAEAQELARHLVLLHDGAVLAEGSLDKLRSLLARGRRLVMEFSAPPTDGWLDGLPATLVECRGKSVELELHGEDSVPDIVRAAVTRQGRLLRCARRECSLAEVMEGLAGGKPR